MFSQLGSAKMQLTLSNHCAITAKSDSCFFEIIWCLKLVVFFDAAICREWIHCTVEFLVTLRWYLLKIKTLTFVKERFISVLASWNYVGFPSCFIFKSKHCRTEIILDVGDLHNIQSPLLVSYTVYIIVDFTACTLFHITDKHGQLHVPQSKVTIRIRTIQLLCIQNPPFHNPFERLEQPSPAKLWTVQFSCSLYLYISLCGC